MTRSWWRHKTVMLAFFPTLFKQTLLDGRLNFAAHLQIILMTLTLFHYLCVDIMETSDKNLEVGILRDTILGRPSNFA